MIQLREYAAGRLPNYNPTIGELHFVHTGRM